MNPPTPLSYNLYRKSLIYYVPNISTSTWQLTYRYMYLVPNPLVSSTSHLSTGFILRYILLYSARPPCLPTCRSPCYIHTCYVGLRTAGINQLTTNFFRGEVYDNSRWADLQSRTWSVYTSGQKSKPNKKILAGLISFLLAWRIRVSLYWLQI